MNKLLIGLSICALLLTPGKNAMANQENKEKPVISSSREENNQSKFEDFSWQYQRQISGDDSKYYPGFEFKWKTIDGANHYTIKISDSKQSKEYKFNPESRNFHGNSTVFRTLYDSDFDTDFDKELNKTNQNKQFDVTIIAFKDNIKIAEHNFKSHFPKKAEITEIKIGDKGFKNDMYVDFPYEIKIYTNQKANKDSAKQNIKIQKSGSYKEIMHEIEVHENYISVKPIEALLHDANYSLNIQKYLANEDRSQNFLDSNKTINFKVNKKKLDELKLDKVLINDDESKDILKKTNYKLTDNDTKISLYFNQPVSFENFDKSNSEDNSQGIYITKDGERQYTTTTRLTNEKFELINNGNKQISKVTFSMVGKLSLSYEDSLNEPLAKNTKYIITVDVKNADKSKLKNNKIILNTGDLEAKKWTLSTKDAKFITPENEGPDAKIKAGEKVILEAISKDGYEFTGWQKPNSLEEDDPKTYKDIVNQIKKQRIEFIMPNTDLYLKALYKNKNGKDSEEKTIQNIDIEKERKDVLKHINSYLLNKKLILEDKKDIPENINALFINDEYLKIIKSEDKFGISIDNNGFLKGKVKIDKWNENESKKEIKLKTTVQMTEKFWNVYNLDSSSTVNESKKKALFDSTYDVDIVITIVKDSDKNSLNQQSNIISKKIEEIKSNIKSVEIEENKYFEDEAQNLVIDLEKLGLELISSSHTNGLQISEKGNLIGLADINDWKNYEKERTFDIELELNINDTDISFPYKVKVKMKKSNTNRVNLIVSEVDPNKLVLLGHLENNKPIFEQESMKWFNSIKNIEVYKDNKWQILDPKLYTKSNELFYILFGKLEKDNIFRIKVDGFETIYFESLDPSIHPKKQDGSFPPSAIGLLNEFDLDEKYLSDKSDKKDDKPLTDSTSKDDDKKSRDDDRKPNVDNKKPNDGKKHNSNINPKDDNISNKENKSDKSGISKESQKSNNLGKKGVITSKQKSENENPNTGDINQAIYLSNIVVLSFAYIILRKRKEKNI
ncbi:hypothetical protein [Helcococcus bovis]|uniref:hypothetical protein n=1 Tax=Helcococcus bovis TaxID=3153252 RepID=UPI0038B91D3A